MNHVPTRRMREHPDLAQLKRQAKELLAACLANEPSAVAEVNAHFRPSGRAAFALHDAQFVLARAYGFGSWRKLKAFVDGINVGRLADAVRLDRLSEVKAILEVRPELVNMDQAENDEHRPLHYAVFARSPAMVRLLMQYGADARKGIYPHRAATTALAIASARGDREIEEIILQEEQRHPSPPSSAPEPEILAVTDPAAEDLEQAVARGDIDFVRARHAESPLVNPIGSDGGLLTVAVTHDQPAMLSLLLDFGFDPDERARLENLEDVVFSQAMPLWHCAGSGKMVMARLLLDRGANPNVHMYAGGSPVYSAYRQQDMAMVELLKSYGGIIDPVTVALFHETGLARQWLLDEAAGRVPPGILEGRNVSEDLLRGAADSADPAILAMSLPGVDWPPHDHRWFWILMQAVWAADAECFSILLTRVDPNLRHPRFARTILHDVAGLGGPQNAGTNARIAAILLDAGARLDVRDDILKSTPLGWACRWGRLEMVQLLLARGADPLEPDAEPWATPAAWARRMGHTAVLDALLTH